MAVVQQTLQIAALDDLAGEFVVVAVRLVVLGVQMEINAWVAGVSVVVTTIVALGDSGVDVIVTLVDLCVDEAVALDDDLPGDDPLNLLEVIIALPIEHDDLLISLLV